MKNKKTNEDPPQDIYVKPHENVDGFLDMINELSAYQKAILILYYIWGFNNPEIGMVFSIRPQKVRMIHKKAIETLKSNFNINFNEVFKH